MNDIQSRIQQMLRKYRLHKRAAALITALSLVMMLVVSYARIQPGVAFGGNTEVSAYKNNVRQLMAAGSFTNPWFDEVVGSIDEVGGAVQIKDEYVTSFDPLTFTAVDGAKACDVSVNLNYVFPPSAVLDIINSDVDVNGGGDEAGATFTDIQLAKSGIK